MAAAATDAHKGTEATAVEPPEQKTTRSEEYFKTNNHTLILYKHNLIFYINLSKAIFDSDITLDMNWFTDEYTKHYGKSQTIHNILQNIERNMSIFLKILDDYKSLEDVYNKDVAILNGSPPPIMQSHRNKYLQDKMAIAMKIKASYESLTQEKSVIFDIFNNAELVGAFNKKKKEELRWILNEYIRHYGNTIPLQLFNQLIGNFNITGDFQLDVKQYYGVKIIRPLIQNCCTETEINKCDKYEIIYNDFEGEELFTHQCLEFFKTQNKIFISKDQKEFIYDNLEENQNISVKYWKDVANRSSSNIVIFTGRTTLLCGNDYNICNTFFPYLGIHYHNRNTMNILISCGNAKSALEMSHVTSGATTTPLISVISFQDRVGSFNNHIFACRSFQLYAAPFFEKVDSKVLGKYFDNTDTTPSIFQTNATDENDPFYGRVKAIFNCINTEMIKFIETHAEKKDKKLNFENIKKAMIKYKPSLIIFNNRDNINFIHDNKDTFHQTYDRLFSNPGKQEMTDFENNLLDFIKLYMEIFTKLNFGELDARFLSIKNDFDNILSKYLLFGILFSIRDKKTSSNQDITIQDFFVKSLYELFTFINNRGEQKFFFLDYYIDPRAKQEENANKYRIRYKELLNDYVSTCNLCFQIETVINEQKRHKYQMELQAVASGPRYCSIWPNPPTLDEETLNFENDINLKVFVEVILDKLEINDPKVRNKTYRQLNKYAETDTTKYINIFVDRLKLNDIIKYLTVLYFSEIITTPHKTINLLEDYNNLDSKNENYYYDNDAFRQFYNEFVSNINSLNGWINRRKGGWISMGGKYFLSNIIKNNNTKKSLTKNNNTKKSIKKNNIGKNK